MSSDLYTKLTNFGSMIMLRNELEDPQGFVNWTEQNFEYVKYNPRKKVDRWGLSITSLDGGVTGLPDLDSLKEYNKEYGTSYDERSFNVPTPVLKNENLKNFLQPIQDKIFRSHILKLNPGGFFPPHRDYFGTKFGSFRIIVPLVNFNPPEVSFVLEDKILNWRQGHMYFLDTAKMHYLFNCSFEPSYWLVLNLSTEEETIDFVIRNVRYG